MADRLLIVHMPEGDEETLDGVLDEAEAASSWRQRTESGVELHVLVRGDRVEATMDAFEQACGDREGFRLALLPLEAWLPRPEGDEDTASRSESDEEPRAVGRISREELYSEIDEQLGVSRVFLAMSGLSAIVAALGLLRDDLAVIIGAMVIAPLLTPNMALALATTLADGSLARRALVANVGGAGVALALAVVIGVVVPVDPTVPSLAQRLDLGLPDLALAVAAGAAGTLALTRGYSGAVIGVMVAVALMPPLVVTGLLAGEGLFAAAGRSGLLTAANVIGVNLAAVVTFALLGLRPRTVWEAERARRASWTAASVWLLLLLTLGAIVWVLGDPDLAKAGAGG